MATEYYIGGDDGKHFDFWNKLYPNQEIPEYSQLCSECNEVIDCNIFIENDKGERRVIGICCSSKYLPKSTSLSLPPKITIEDVQTLSQEEKIQTSTHFDDGKYKGFSFESVFQNDPGYLEYLSSKPSEVGSAIHNASLYFLEHKDQVKPFFRFGKYRGMTFERVKEINPGYYSFLLKNESSNERYSEAINWYKSIPHEPTLPIGKWKNTTYTEVASKDPDYMKWVIRNITDSNSPLHPFCLWIKQNYPHISTSPPRKTVVTPLKDEGIINYGKHMGKTLQQIWDEDEDYFIYLARKSSLFGSHATFNREAINFFIEKRGYKINDQLTIGTGKHKGKTVLDVANENPDFFEWLQDGCRSKDESLLQAAIWWRINRTKCT